MAQIDRASSCRISLMFQSLKGFQRFCGGSAGVVYKVYCYVSIPKRVSEVLWPSPKQRM